jgi:hypothetical protein
MDTLSEVHIFMHKTYKMGYAPGEWIKPGTGSTLFRVPGNWTIAKGKSG